ncbi:MAG: hypothetical protein V4587_03005 [Acidobacteriota bacterium]
MPKLLTQKHSAPTIEDDAYARFCQRRHLRAGLLKKETSQAQLADRMRQRLDAVQTYLEDDKVWFAKLEKAPLRDLAIMEGVWIDKLQLVEGKATQTIAHQHHEKLDEVLPLLLQSIQQRGLTIGLSERTIEVKT